MIGLENGVSDAPVETPKLGTKIGQLNSGLPPILLKCGIIMRATRKNPPEVRFPDEFIDLQLGLFSLFSRSTFIVKPSEKMKVKCNFENFVFPV